MDRMTGLVWIKNANCWGAISWDQAQTKITALNQGHQTCPGYSSTTIQDWRLPSIQELQTLVTSTGTPPGLPPGHPFTGFASGFYWASDPSPDFHENGWDVSMADGTVYHDFKSSTHLVWPVRGTPSGTK